MRNWTWVFRDEGRAAMNIEIKRCFF